MTPEILDGRYRLDEIIGEGGAATVYQAWDLWLERPVAVKVLRPDAGLGEPEVEAFLREGRIMAGLNHPHIVQVHDVGVSASRPYLVMELLPGGTLRDRLARGPLPVGMALFVARRLAGALELAHRRGILHLDVKPENILFGRDGEPKLADFGISQSPGERQDGEMIRGTAAYLAPEVVSGEPLDPRADVYALGVLLYEMLTGRPPFQGADPVEQAAQRLVADPIPPQEMKPSVPARLGEIVLQALSRDPAQRFASPSHLAAALHDYQVQAEQYTTAIPRRSAATPPPRGQAQERPRRSTEYPRAKPGPAARSNSTQTGCLWTAIVANAESNRSPRAECHSIPTSDCGSTSTHRSGSNHSTNRHGRCPGAQPNGTTWTAVSTDCRIWRPAAGPARRYRLGGQLPPIRWSNDLWRTDRDMDLWHRHSVQYDGGCIQPGRATGWNGGAPH